MEEYRPNPFETRTLTVVAQDPSVRDSSNKILTTNVVIPAESLQPGPRGARIRVIDYDTYSNRMYSPRGNQLGHDLLDPAVLGRDWTNEDILENHEFHAQNVYAIVSSTLFRFESALGRHVPWCFSENAHQLNIAPHAFRDGNAYYSRYGQCLAFGYFKGRRGDWIHTCLSHDVVTHEATHALLDGIRPFFNRPSSPDQAAFHEGFADIVAILSVFRSPELISFAIGPDAPSYPGMIESHRISFESLHDTSLLQLAEQLGQEVSGIRHSALRNSLRIPPGRCLDNPNRQDPHSRGELLVAAVLRAFLKVWVKRLEPIVGVKSRLASRDRVVEEGTKAAAHLLTMAIRALDYLPPTDMVFSDYLSALVTADVETYPSERPYYYRTTLLDCFSEFGIDPTAETSGHGGQWSTPLSIPKQGFSHAEPMKSDPEAVYRYVWENRACFHLHPDAFSRVLSVRPVVRTGHDGFVVRETVAECVQTLKLQAGELSRLRAAPYSTHKKKVRVLKPEGMPDDTEVSLYGSNTLVFDEFGQLKYDIGTSVVGEKQTMRLESLWNRGHYEQNAHRSGRFAELHRRTPKQAVPTSEIW